MVIHKCSNSEGSDEIEKEGCKLANKDVNNAELRINEKSAL